MVDPALSVADKLNGALEMPRAREQHRSDPDVARWHSQLCQMAQSDCDRPLYRVNIGLGLRGMRRAYASDKWRIGHTALAFR